MTIEEKWELVEKELAQSSPPKVKAFLKQFFLLGAEAQEEPSYRLKALEMAINAGSVGSYEPADGSLLVKRAKTFEAYLRGDREDAKEEPKAAKVSHADHIARLNTGAVQPPAGQETI